MAEYMLKRKLFGLNGNRLENFFICKLDTYERWKNGELLFFPEEKCFSGFDITEERDEKILELFDEDGKENENWRNEWSNLTHAEKASWWWNFIRNEYIALTYDEFMSNSNYIAQNIRMSFHVGDDDIEGIVFFTPAPKDMRKVEV